MTRTDKIQFNTLAMQAPEHVAIFWDLGTALPRWRQGISDLITEDLPPLSGAPGYDTVNSIRSIAHVYGEIISFKAYVEVSSTLRLWSELQASGVSLIHCPHNGRKDKMLMVDMVTFAIDHPAPATVLLISGNHDFTYAISILRHRKYKVVVLCPSNTQDFLVAQASEHLDWDSKILGVDDTVDPPLAPPLPSSAPKRRPNDGRTPSDLKGKAKGVYQGRSDYSNEEHGPYLRQPRANGHSNIFSYEETPWRAPSQATSRPYSPAGSFKSAKSTPPTPPSPERKTVEPTWITNGDLVFESSSQPELPQGFPFAGKEDMKGPAAATAAFSPTEPEKKTQAKVSPSPKAGFPTSWNETTPTPAAQAPILPAPSPTGMTKIPAAVGIPTDDTPNINHAAAPPAPPPMQMPKSPLPTPAAPMRQLSGPSKPPLPSPTPPSMPVLKNPLPTPAAPTRPLSGPSKASPPKPSIETTRTTSAHFLPLIDALKKRVGNSEAKVMRTDLGPDLKKVPNLYAKAGVSKFAAYMLLASEAGIVTLGGSGNDAWVALRPEWLNSAVFPS